jgi:hypothetical protein
MSNSLFHYSTIQIISFLSNRTNIKNMLQNCCQNKKEEKLKKTSVYQKLLNAIFVLKT